jgi:hypothetical protein
MRLTYAMSLLLVLPQLCMLAAGQTTPGPAWGASVEGLRLGVAVVEGATREQSVEITFENAGSQDALLNLGFMVGNGRTMVPHAIRLVVRGVTFGTCELEYADPRVTHVGGRLDDLVVGLPRSGRYSVRLPLRDFWCGARKQWPMPWPDEPLHVFARFRGGPAVSVTLDMPGMRLMHFWRGTLESGAVTLRVPPD